MRLNSGNLDVRCVFPELQNDTLKILFGVSSANQSMLIEGIHRRETLGAPCRRMGMHAYCEVSIRVAKWAL
jgi:hypothetical protein